jgi:exodeoxyribonuclease VII small subunit
MAKVEFEKSLAKLEQIVAEMEAGELSLDQMLAKFKEGVTLAEACSKRLSEAERAIEILTKSADGRVETKPFDAGPETGEQSEGESL